MKYFLIVFQRSKGKILELDQYDDGHKAQSARTVAERKYYYDPQHKLYSYLDSDIEVVVLSAQDLDTVKRTHSRYFRNA